MNIPYRLASVYNRHQIEEIEPMPGTVLISICSPPLYDQDGSQIVFEKTEPKLKPGWYDVVQLVFHDVDVYLWDGHENSQGFIFFDEKMRDVLRSTVGRYADMDKNFCIHCDAGMSRSVAIAAWIRDEFRYKVSLNAHPNFDRMNNRVYSMLRFPDIKEDAEFAFRDIEQ